LSAKSVLRRVVWQRNARIRLRLTWYNCGFQNDAVPHDSRRLTFYEHARRAARERGWTLFRVPDRPAWYFLVPNDTWSRHGLLVAAKRAWRFQALRDVITYLQQHKEDPRVAALPRTPDQ
jgi:hypothetical protein